MFSSGCFVFDSEHFRRPYSADFTVVKFSDDDRNCGFSNSYYDAQFTCRSSRIKASTLSSVSIVALVASWPLRYLFSVSYLRLTTDLASNWPNIYGVLTLYVSQTSLNLYRTGAFHS